MSRRLDSTSEKNQCERVQHQPPSEKRKGVSTSKSRKTVGNWASSTAVALLSAGRTSLPRKLTQLIRPASLGFETQLTELSIQSISRSSRLILGHLINEPGILKPHEMSSAMGGNDGFSSPRPLRPQIENLRSAPECRNSRRLSAVRNASDR